MSHRVGGIRALRAAALSLLALAAVVLPALGTPASAGHAGSPSYGGGSIRLSMDIDGVPYTGIFQFVTSTDEGGALDDALADLAARFPGATVAEVDESGGVSAQAVLKPYMWPDGAATWGYNSAGAPAVLTNALAVFDAAAATWNASGAAFAYDSVGATAANTGACSGAGLDGHNTIGWRDQANNVLAVTCSWYVGSTAPKSSVEFDMEFDPDWDWSTGTPISFDLQSIAVHEMGHALGLAHSPITEAVMYKAYAAGADKRALHADDVAGATQIYGGAGPADQPVAEDAPDSPGTKGGGPGADGGGPDAGFPPPPEDFTIPSGSNLMTWPYEDTSVTALALKGTDTVYAFDGESGSWMRYSPAFPKTTNTMMTLRLGYAYWFMTTDSLEISASEIGY
jgi:Matrixin